MLPAPKILRFLSRQCQTPMSRCHGDPRLTRAIGFSPAARIVWSATEIRSGNSAYEISRALLDQTSSPPGTQDIQQDWSPLKNICIGMLVGDSQHDSLLVQGPPFPRRQNQRYSLCEIIRGNTAWRTKRSSGHIVDHETTSMLQRNQSRWNACHGNPAPVFRQRAKEHGMVTNSPGSCAYVPRLALRRLFKLFRPQDRGPISICAKEYGALELRDEGGVRRRYALPTAGFLLEFRTP